MRSAEQNPEAEEQEGQHHDALQDQDDVWHDCCETAAANAEALLVSLSLSLSLSPFSLSLPPHRCRPQPLLFARW